MPVRVVDGVKCGEHFADWEKMCNFAAQKEPFATHKWGFVLLATTLKKC